MKKFLALFLALLMCVGILASCGGGNNTDAATLDDAKELLDTMMKDKNGKVLANDYDVPAKLVIGDTEFEVTWKTDNKDIKVKESSKKGFWTIDLPNVNAKEVEYKLTATIKDADGKTIEATFTPKLAVIDNAGLETEFKANVEYKAYIKQVNLGYDVYVLNTTQKGENKFIETTMDPKEAAVFKFEIVEGGYKIYTMINGVKNYLHATATPKADKPDSYTKTIGFAETTDCVFTYDSALSLFKIKLNGVEFGVGTYGTYETVSLSESKYFKADNINVKEGQFPMSFMTKENADKLPVSVKPENKDPEANKTLTIAEAIALGNTKVKDQYTEAKYYIEGTIKEIQSDVYGNLVITDGTNDLLIYGTYSEDGKTRFDKLATKPAVGDKIKVYGVIGKYNDAQMKNGWIVGAVAGENAGGNTGDTPATPSDKTEVVTTPVAGTAYKFGAVQGNVNNKLLFINGEMANTYYFATTTNAADAIDVYVEAVTGGYNLYYMNGTTKTYINIKAGGQHVNVKYETSDPTVYTFDATLKTFVTDITCENADKTGTYCFGTYNTYETVSPTMITKDNFPCQLYTVVEGEGGTETPENPGTEPENPGTEPENPGTPDTPACTEHADADNNYVCDTEGCNVVVEPTADTLTIAEALKLGAAFAHDTYSSKSYSVTGVITEINEAYSTKYKNITVTISVDGSAIKCFRLSYDIPEGEEIDKCANLAKGDTITVCGTIGQYSGTPQIKGKLTNVVVHEHNYEGEACTICGAVNPDYVPDHTCADGDDEDFICDNPDCNEIVEPVADTLTIAEALKLGAAFEHNTYSSNSYSITGVITEINEAYSTKYKNITVTISADGSAIKCFRLSYDIPEGEEIDKCANLAKGDTITVCGTIGQYNGTPQISAKLTNVVAHEHAYSDATCTAPKTCSICGATDGEALEHNYVDGTCDACGAEEPSGDVVATQTATIVFATDKSNRTEYDTQHQIWTGDGITVTNNKDASTNNVGDFGPIRLYKNSEVIVAFGQNMTQIQFTCNVYQNNDYVTPLVASLANIGTATADGQVVTVVLNTPATSITFNTTAQIRLDSLTVTYAA